MNNKGGKTYTAISIAVRSHRLYPESTNCVRSLTPLTLRNTHHEMGRPIEIKFKRRTAAKRLAAASSVWDLEADIRFHKTRMTGSKKNIPNPTARITSIRCV